MARSGASDAAAWGAIAELRKLSADAQAINERNVELAYAEITSNATATSTAGFVDIAPALQITVTPGSRPFELEFFCAGVYHSVSGGQVIGAINELPQGTGLATRAFVRSSAAGAAAAQVMIAKRRLIRPAGVAVTFKIQAIIATAGTGTFAAQPDYPTYLRATET